jgi:progesterone-induced-blocking factor 1
MFEREKMERESCQKGLKEARFES